MRMELKGIDDALSFLPEGIVYKAARRAINKVGPSAKAVVTEEVSREWNIPAGELAKRLTVKLGAMTNLEYLLLVSGRSVALTYFGAQEIRGMRVRTVRRGAIVSRSAKRLAKAGPLPMGVVEEAKKGRRQTLAKAFFQKMKSGHAGVFVRIKGQKMKSNPKKDYIQAKSVVSVASMFSQARVNGLIIIRVEGRWDVVWPHELDYAISEAGR